ncbi:MAG: AMP-binding protein [Candidatus Calescibacterium sp.]|nr:AMP-binding protein [Candidatus Calescibacterium sp.]MCX7734070.1 AMP-binding protein [bacterium]MDW8087068.1 AMP-binding protein [Candidatus Calescibacterium sp.]
MAWEIPFQFNMGQAMLSSPDEDGLAFIYYDGKEKLEFTYHQTKIISRKIGGFIKSKVEKTQSIVALISEPIPELLFTHIGVYLSGNISMPISPVLGDELLRKRMVKARPKIIFCSKSNFERLQDIAKEIESEIYTIEDIKNTVVSAKEIESATTYPETPAIILFTSGSEKEPKGVIHGHKILLARSVIFKYMVQEINGLIWDIADWGWMAGMFYGPFPAMYLKKPFLIYRMKKFDPDEALHIIKKFNIKIVFMPPTALRIIQKESNKQRFDYQIESLLTAGEYVGEGLFEWSKSFFGIEPTEFYSQTEGGPIIANSPKLFRPKPASMGKTIPGVAVKLVDEKGNEINKPGEIGDICISISSPISMLGYFGEDLKTEFGWFKTGDTAYFDDQGYFFYKGRKDKIIKTSGYRISPEEVEDVVRRYAGTECVVIPEQDETRQYILKILTKDENEKIAMVVRKYIGPHIKFSIEKVDEFPKTITGKIRR